MLEDKDPVDYKKLYEEANLKVVKAEANTSLLTAQLADIENLVTTQDVTLTLSEEAKEQLDDLMVKDPVAWRKEMNKLENEAKQGRKAKLTEIKVANEQGNTAHSRDLMLNMFNVDKTDKALTKEQLDLDVPPRLKAKFDKGEVDYITFLGLAHDYVYNQAKTTKKEGEPAEPNINNMSGKADPTKGAKVDMTLAEKYSNLKL